MKIMPSLAEPSHHTEPSSQHLPHNIHNFFTAESLVL